MPHSVQPHISLPPGGGRPRNQPTTRGKHALHQVELDTMHQGVAPFATHQTVTHTAVANLRLYLSHDRSGLLPTVEAYRNQTYAMRMRFEARQAGVLKRGLAGASAWFCGLAFGASRGIGAISVSTSSSQCHAHGDMSTKHESIELGLDPAKKN